MSTNSVTTKEPLLEVEELRKVYRNRRRGNVVAVDGVSFRMWPGEVVGLLGPNGAGKTTTIKCVCTLVRATSGRVDVAGVDAIGQSRKAMEKVSAVLEGNRNVYWRLTPRENLEFFAALQGIPTRTIRTQIDALLERFDLAVKRDTPALSLSKGMQQKLALACAFVKGTPLLLLDEPTLGLDVEASRDLRSQIREMAASGEHGIVLSSHDMAVVQDVCDRVVIISGGRVVTDDRVANLIGLFKARAYHLELTGTLDNDRRATLRSAFPLLEVTNQSDRATIQVELPDSADLYRLMDLLRESDAAVESIDRQDPDLEEIFLRVVRGEKR